MSFQLLPSEIVAEIISHAANICPTTSLTQSPDDQSLKSLAGLCRVCKAFNVHASRLLYAAVTVKDLDSPLLESLVINASRVRSLIILEHRAKRLFEHNPRPYNSEDLERWSKLEDAVECMENLESVVYEVDYCSPRLSVALSQRPFLRHLTAQNTVPFFPGPPPTQSLAIYWLPHQAHLLKSLQSLLACSAGILRKLHLSLNYVNAPEVAGLLATVFSEPYRLQLSELVLDIPSFTPAVVKTLVGSIDMAGLVRLDLRGSQNADCLLDALTGQVKSLRWLRVEGASAVRFIASFSGLEQLYWVNRQEWAVNIPAVLAQHGASLRKLCLVTDCVFTAADVQTLTSACQKLEILDFSADFAELESIAESLATLKSLQELYIAPYTELNVLTLPSGPYHVRPCRFGEKTLQQSELFCMYPFLPYIVDGIDAALGLLLVSGVSCPDITIKGIVPPCCGIFDHTLVWGRGVPHTKRWVKNGKAGEDEYQGVNFRGGNTGDRYICEGVEGEWELMGSFISDERWETEPLGKDRVPFCCARDNKGCLPNGD